MAEIRDPALYGTELVKGATTAGMLCPLKLCMKLHQLGEFLTRLGSATLVKVASLWVYCPIGKQMTPRPPSPPPPPTHTYTHTPGLFVPPSTCLIVADQSKEIQNLKQSQNRKLFWSFYNSFKNKGEPPPPTNQTNKQKQTNSQNKHVFSPILRPFQIILKVQSLQRDPFRLQKVDQHRPPWSTGL